MKHLLLIIFALTLAACACPKDPAFATWSSGKQWNVPIKVYDDAEVLWFDEALSEWNKAGCKIFERTKDEDEADIKVVRGPEYKVSNNKKKKGKKVRLAGSWNKKDTVTIYGYRGAGRDYGVLLHELGHSLGLRHDYESRTSIMKPGNSSKYNSSKGLKPLPTESDLIAIKHRFCK